MVAPPKPVRIALGEAVERYLDAMQARVSVGGLSAATTANYRCDLHEFVRIVGADIVVDDIDGPRVDNALGVFATTADRRYSNPTAKRGSGRAVSTQVRFKQSVDRFFAHAENTAWVQVSPMGWVTLDPKVRGGLRVARTSLTAHQAQALLLHGPGDPDPDARAHERNYDRDRFLLAVLLVLGPRVSEVCRADKDDFGWDGDQEVWRIMGKGGKARRVPLSPWLSGLKSTYLASRPSPATDLDTAHAVDAGRALFRTGRGGRMAPRDVQRLLQRAHRRVLTKDPRNAREATPHALRHTAATLLVAAGWDVKVVASMLGHASISTTGIYLDELPGELAHAVSAHPLTGLGTRGGV